MQDFIFPTGQAEISYGFFSARLNSGLASLIPKLISLGSGLQDHILRSDGI